MENVQSHDPWNKSKLVGQKLPLKLKDISQSAFIFNAIITFGTWRYSTSPSTASCAAVIS